MFGQKYMIVELSFELKAFGSFSPCCNNGDDKDDQVKFHGCNRGSNHCSFAFEYWWTIRNNSPSSESRPVVSLCLREPGDELRLTTQLRVSRICCQGHTNWAFLFLRFLASETKLAQVCCRKKEALHRWSLFCRHCPVLGSFCILSKTRNRQ